MVWEEILSEEFQDGHRGSHLGYRNGMTLAIPNVCHCDASHQVWAQSNLQFGRRCRLKNMKMAGHLEYQNGTILTILNLYVAPMPPMKFRLI